MNMQELMGSVDGQSSAMRDSWQWRLPIRIHANDARVIAIVLVVALYAPLAPASDHADPVDLFGSERLEGGITDLFVFPVTKDDQAANRFTGNERISLSDPLFYSGRKKLSDEDRQKVDALIVVLCVRRALTQTNSLMLEPYTYKVHFDLHTPVTFVTRESVPTNADPVYPAVEHAHDGSIHTHPQSEPQASGGYTPDAHTHGKGLSPEEAFVRYGGAITAEDSKLISDDVVLEITLDNNGMIRTFCITGSKAAGWEPNNIKRKADVFDDPFIFPAFLGTNVVGMVFRLPLSYFPPNQQDFLIWGTSHKGSRQVDHVGRSLRTQNPRFEILNTLHPSQHVKAIDEAHNNPTLMRDFFLRIGINNLFAYRTWDHVPDVMIFTTQFEAGFPNGRFLQDDVAALLAQHGDTLLYELSYLVGPPLAKVQTSERQLSEDDFPEVNPRWPRLTRNDKLFKSEFPFLAEKWRDKPASPPPTFSMRNKIKIGLIVLGIVTLLWVTHWVAARVYFKRKTRRRYL